MNFRKALLPLLITYAAVTASSSQAITVFKVGDIEGGFPGVPEYNGWSVADTLTGNFSENQCGAIMLEKEADKASVKYIEAAVLGTVFPKVEIHDLRNFEGGFEPETIIEIANAKISNVEAAKQEGEPLREIVSIQPLDMKIQFRLYDLDGNPVGNVETTVSCGYKVK